MSFDDFRDDRAVEIEREKEYAKPCPWVGMVREFHEAYGCDIDVPAHGEAADLRANLINEEAEETTRELFSLFLDGEAHPEEAAGWRTAALDGLCDLIYVAIGTAVAFGWDIEEAMRRVHRSNMSKLGVDGKPIRRDDGKVLKGPDFKAPRLEDLV